MAHYGTLWHDYGTINHEAFLAGDQWVRPLPERFEERSQVFREARRIERHWF